MYSFPSWHEEASICWSTLYYAQQRQIKLCSCAGLSESTKFIKLLFVTHSILKLHMMTDPPNFYLDLQTSLWIFLKLLYHFISLSIFYILNHCQYFFIFFFLNLTLYLFKTLHIKARFSIQYRIKLDP